MPEIYVDQQTEVYLRDTNIIKKSYLQALSLAKSTGLAVTALTDEEFKKIGVRRNQLLITADTIGAREESWGFSFQGPASNPGQCIFSLTYTGTLSIQTPNRSVKYNLENRKMIDQEAGIPEAFLLHFKALPIKPSTEEEENIPTDVQLTGRGVLLQQPYVEWTYPDSSMERIWSNGREWGFSELPSRKNHAAPGALVLAFEKPTGSQRLVMTTKELQIDKKVDRTPFQFDQHR
ncbi:MULTISPECIES: hypothetical protein [Olivibacter]|uniref:Uncharacterized protein n=1 Tax=Olivibacter jilunii TaxID=985016 RepID=A0ABW6AZP0_9SPHI